MTPIFAALFIFVFSIGAVQASDRDCNALMKSYWDSSISDLASLRIDLDLQRASGTHSMMAHALENAYARKFSELLDLQKRQSISGDLDALLKQKILENQLIKNSQVTDLVQHTAAQTTVAKKTIMNLVVEVENYASLPWAMSDGVAIKTDSNTVVIVSVSKSSNSLTYATLDLATREIKHTQISLAHEPESVQVVSASQVLVESRHALFDVNPITKTASITTQFKSPVENRSRTRLNDGQFVFSGGRSKHGMIQNVVAFNPANLNQSELPQPEFHRFLHKLVTLLDGRILVVGGTGGGNGHRVIEVIDPVKNTTERVGELEQGRVDFTATLLSDGRVVVVGGAKAVEVIDVAARQVYTIGTLPEFRENHAATLLPDDRIVISGGKTVDDLLKTIFLIDADEKSIRKLGKLSDPRAGHSQVMISDHEILVLGGYTLDSPIFTVEKINLKEAK